MSGFLDIVLIGVIILGIVYVICCFKTLINIRRKKVNKKEIENAYCYVIIVAILYFLFWILKIKQ